VSTHPVLLLGRGLSLRLRAFATNSIDAGDNRSVKLRTGDRAILVGALAIAAYEKYVVDDDDLISYRVSAYRKHWLGRLIADAVILSTALHLAEAYPSPELDAFHHAMSWLRRNVGPQE
jgi:hypothetical protein